MLYTFPLMAVHASCFLLCDLSTDGGTRSSVSTPRRSSPEDFNCAQSSGPNPGASATFLEGLGGFWVVASGDSKDEDATRVLDSSPLEVALARVGTGGGGISALSLSTVGIVGTAVLLAGAGAEARCVLFSEGKAGGTSSSVSVSDLSSSSSSTKDPGTVRLLF